MLGGMTVPVQVGGGHRGGEGLAHPVQHQLDRGRPELTLDPCLAPVQAGRFAPSPAGPLAAGQQVVDLAQAAAAVPPQGADHVAGERAVLGRLPVGVERVRDAEFVGRADTGILEPGDPQRVQVRLGREQAGPQLGRAGGREVRCDQAHGPVVQRPGGPSGLVTFDPPVGRIERARVDPGSLQGHGVDPGAVVIAVRQEGRPPAGDRVQVRRGRQAAGEGGHGPAAAEHPGVRVQPGAVGGHRGQAVPPGTQAQQVAAQALQTTGHRVHVRVAERGQGQPPAQRDDAGTRTGDLPDLLVRADGLDQAVANGQGLDEPGRVRGGAHLPAGKDQVGLAVAGCHGPARGPVRRRSARARTPEWSGSSSSGTRRNPATWLPPAPTRPNVRSRAPRGPGSPS